MGWGDDWTYHPGWPYLGLIKAESTPQRTMPAGGSSGEGWGGGYSLDIQYISYLGHDHCKVRIGAGNSHGETRGGSGSKLDPALRGVTFQIYRPL